MVIKDSLRNRLLSSKNFIPWNDGKVNAAFESVNDDGEIIIQMKGRNATFGPFDPFLIACETLLWNVESMSGEIETTSEEFLMETGILTTDGLFVKAII